MEPEYWNWKKKKKRFPDAVDMQKHWFMTLVCTPTRSWESLNFIWYEKINFSFIVSLDCEITNKNDRNRKYKKVFEQGAKILKEWDQSADGTTGWEIWCSLTLRSGGFNRETEVMVIWMWKCEAGWSVTPLGVTLGLEYGSWNSHQYRDFRGPKRNLDIC